MNKLERLQEIAANPDVLMFPSRHMKDYGDVMKALSGLLKVCDEYVEAETFRLNESGGWYSDSETYEEWLSRNHKRAKEKLEMMLG